MQARSVTEDPSGPYRTVDSFDILTTSPFPGCNSIDDLFVRAVQLYGPKDCLGTRELLSEDDEMQPNGKVFRKVRYLFYMIVEFVIPNFRSVFVVFFLVVSY